MSVGFVLALALAAAVVISVVRFTLPPRASLIVYMSVAFFAPLVVLWLFLAAAYRHWSWAPFNYGSGVPPALAALTFIVLLITGLLRASASPGAKVAMGLIASGLWLVAWFVGTIFTACAMGDCF